MTAGVSGRRRSLYDLVEDLPELWLEWLETLELLELLELRELTERPDMVDGNMGYKKCIWNVEDGRLSDSTAPFPARRVEKADNGKTKVVLVPPRSR